MQMKNYFRLAAVVVWAIACTCFLPSAWAGPVLDHIRNSGQITLGVRDASPPFSYVPEPGKASVGYSVDLCEKVVEAIRKKLSLKKLSINQVIVTAGNRIDTVLKGKVDLNCESTTNSVERRQQVAFSVPHYITGSRYLVRANANIQDLRDFEGGKLVSTTGSLPLKMVEQAIKERSLKITLLQVADHPKAVEMVEKGEADGFVTDEILLVAQIATRPDPDKLTIVGKYLTIDALGIMMSSSDVDLKFIVDTELRRLIQTREIYALHDRWFLQPIPPSGKSLNVRMPYMLKDFWKYPSDWVPN
jgi:ABC-type amino acid transport substrate-binding protein